MPQENVSYHEVRLIQLAANDLNIETLQHLSCSLNLVSLQNFFVKTLKQFKRNNFDSNEPDERSD